MDRSLVLQIRIGKWDNLGIICHMSPLKHIFCDPSLERSQRKGSNEGSQHMFSFRNTQKLSLNYLQYSLLFGTLEVAPFLNYLFVLPIESSNFPHL